MVLFRQEATIKNNLHFNAFAQNDFSLSNRAKVNPTLYRAAHYIALTEI